MRGGASESLPDLPLHFHYFKNRLKITPKNTVVLMHPNQTPVFYVVDVKGLSTFPSWTSRVRVPSPAPKFFCFSSLQPSILLCEILDSVWLQWRFGLFPQPVCESKWCNAQEGAEVIVVLACSWREVVRRRVPAAQVGAVRDGCSGVVKVL